MSDLAISALCIGSASLALLAGVFVGWHIGRADGLDEGRDAQWCDDYFSRIERDKAGRDALGRFKSPRNHGMVALKNAPLPAVDRDGGIINPHCYVKTKSQ